MTGITYSKPLCARCVREVDGLSVTRVGGAAVFRAECHGEVEVVSLRLADLHGVVRLIGDVAFRDGANHREDVTC